MGSCSCSICQYTRDCQAPAAVGDDSTFGPVIPTNFCVLCGCAPWWLKFHHSRMATDPSYQVVIECPVTHKRVATGLAMTKEAFAHPAVWESAVECPQCGQRHEYNMGQAWLQTDDRRGPRPAIGHPYGRGRRRHKLRKSGSSADL